MTEKLKPSEIRMIPIDRIDVLNPRERNKGCSMRSSATSKQSG